MTGESQGGACLISWPDASNMTRLVLVKYCVCIERKARMARKWRMDWPYFEDLWKKHWEWSSVAVLSQ